MNRVEFVKPPVYKNTILSIDVIKFVDIKSLLLFYK